MRSGGLKIAFFGSSLVSSYWNGAATYYRGLLSALHERGHEIVFYEPDAYDRQKHRDLEDISYATSFVYQAEDESGVRNALEEASRADVVVKASGVGVFDRFLEEEVPKLTYAGALTVFWDVDAPATLDRIGSDIEDPFNHLLKEYDLILTYGGGDPVVNKYSRFGAKLCVPVYNALDPKTHHRVDPVSKFSGTLGFLGNRMPDREHRVREFFFNPAKVLPKSRFLLGGNGWDSYVPVLSNVSYLGHVYTQEHNAFNSSTRVVLNISRESMAKYGFSPATRVFEAAGAGACIITDMWEGVGMFLKPESECLVASNGEDVVEYIRNLTDDEAKKIGNAAKERVLAEHTYSHRAEQVEKILIEAFQHRGGNP